MNMLNAAAASLLLIGAAPALAQSADFGVSAAPAAGGGIMAPAHQFTPRPGDFTRRPGWRSDWADGNRPDHRGGWRKRCLQRERCRGRDHGYVYGYGYGYGYAGIAFDPLIAGAMGYFVQDGDRPRVVDGRARFDYDRGYPYEYRYEGRPRVELSEAVPEYRVGQCTDEQTRDRRTGRDVAVRVCRN